jgi:hypothetical protein
MVSADDRAATRRARRLWLVPLLLLVHNAEEAFTVRPVLPLVNARLAATLPGRLPAVRYGEFLVALVVVTVLPFAIAAAGDLRRADSRAGYLLLVVQTTLLLNVVSHLTTATVVGGYAPGLASAVLVNLPYSLVLLSAAWRERWYRPLALVGIAPAALLVHGPGLIGLVSLVGLLS